MNISLFEVLGPVMIGPSSSHTAGAAKLARVARIIAEHPFHRVTFGLYGSFAKTGVVGAVSGLLAEGGLNIAVMRVSRVAKGDIANCVIETDGRIGDELVRRIRQLPNVRSVRAINI